MRKLTAVVAVSFLLVFGSAVPAGAVDHEHDFFNHLWERASCMIQSLTEDLSQLRSCLK